VSLRFHFDFISPYAYLGWLRMPALAERVGRPLEPVPVLFAALLDRWGQLGPAEIAPKRAYTYKHALRLAHDQGVPLVPPPAHPFNPLLALRVASLSRGFDERRRIIDALYRACWGGGPGVDNPATVARALDEAGLAGAALVEEATTPAVKARLREQTDRAIADGVFGVPTVIVDGELFWGQDALPHVERFVAGADPIDPAHLASVRAMPASATRPGSARPHSDDGSRSPA
jgi:2-hydroxychromene-2-carboxylate isomerase